MQLTVPARDPAQGPETPSAQVAEVPTRQVPSFDIVRVERSGEAVIAGRAAPRSRITVLQDDRPIATVEADERGEFVAIPDRRLPPGQRQLTLRSEDPESGETTESDRAVVIDIPRLPDDDQPEPADSTRTAERDESARERGAQVATRSRSDVGAQEAADVEPGGEETASPDGDQASSPPTTGSSTEVGTAPQAEPEDTTGAAGGDVAVRGNRPTAEPPLLTDRGKAEPAPSTPTDTPTGSAGQTRAADLPVSVPAPPESGERDDPPAATVTDVPEPPKAGPQVTTRSTETEDQADVRVTARQDRAPTAEADGQIATRSMRPRAASPPDSDDRAAAGARSEGGARSRGDAPIAVLVPREGTGEVEVLQRPSGETGLSDQELVLEAVQYTVDGGISISGRAPADALVVAYLNDSELARTRAPADGSWTMAPKADVPPGLHTLRVDQLGPDGEVLARVSTPFANQPMVDQLDEDEGMVVIQPGDNLWTIARRTYGEGWEFTLIYRANRDQIRDPDLIYPGQVFVVPEEQRRETGDGD